MVFTTLQVSVNPAYQLQEAEYALRKVGDIHIPVFTVVTTQKTA